VSIEDGIHPERLINYEHHWRFNWEGQTNLELPIIRVPLNEPFFLSSSLDQNLQFFCYKEKERTYLKAATMYEEDLSLLLKFSPIQSGYRDAYCDLYPQAHDYVYQWYTLFEKIRRQYGIKVLCHQTATDLPMIGNPLSEDELSDVSTILEEELSFYSESFFDTIPLKTIVVCGDVVVDSSTLKGHQYRDGILLNSSSTVGEMSIRRTIHHEIFHIVENTLSPDRLNDINQDWEKLPADDQFVRLYHLSRLQITPSEYRAELFSYYAIDPGYIHHLAQQDSTVRAKWEIVKMIFLGFDAETQLRSIENSGVVTTKVVTNRQTDITGELRLTTIKHSCANLLNTLLLEPIPKFDRDEILDSSAVICLTINPLDYCAFEFVERSASPDASMEFWIEEHECLLSHNVHFLQSEKIYQLQWAFLKRFFAGFGREINVKSIRGHSDRIRPLPLKNVPLLDKVWKHWRGHPILTKTGYHHISFQE
jgi:hypothetical protein